MKAVRFHEFGGPEVLKYEDAPDPKPRKDQILVRVKACALNHLDLWVRKGLPGVKLPHINGSDVSGDIVEVGEYITDLKPGQRVLLAPMVYCGQCEHCIHGVQNMCRQFTVLGNGVDGGNCELITTARANVIPIPDELTYDEAASVPLVFLTAWHMLVGRAGVKPGDYVLVLGGGSGVGVAAIQIAKMHGAKVIATAGDETKLEQCRDLGAEYLINHYKQTISEEVKKITWKAGADIVFEHVGQATFEESVKSLKAGGKLVTCGATTGPEAKFDIRMLFAKQLSFLGSYMGTMGELHAVLKHIFRGALKPVVDKTFPLRDARAAHERLEARRHFGKVVLNP
ncbi:MAG: zinc-binding dehydrogenase [Acidobacteriales bacterium]|nr:zinc-binding dehydrogenase [Terriglobales bacterium]